MRQISPSQGLPTQVDANGRTWWYKDAALAHVDPRAQKKKQQQQQAAPKPAQATLKVAFVLWCSMGVLCLFGLHACSQSLCVFTRIQHLLSPLFGIFHPGGRCVPPGRGRVH